MGKDQIGLRRAMMGLLFLLPLELAEAHPAHAKPVNYPFVVGFERFHSGMDDDDYLAEGGFILLNELNQFGDDDSQSPLFEARFDHAESICWPGPRPGGSKGD